MAKPKSHHLDKHAHRIAADSPGDGDDLLDQEQMAAWFRCSEQWLVAGRHSGYGPPFERIGPMLIRYNRRKVLAWLDQRSHLSTDEYDTSRWRGKGMRKPPRKARRAAR